MSEKKKRKPSGWMVKLKYATLGRIKHILFSITLQNKMCLNLRTQDQIKKSRMLETYIIISCLEKKQHSLGKFLIHKISRT